MNPDRYLRTFDVLNLLIQHKEGLRLTEIRAALELPVSSVHNMLQTMVSAEVATVTDDLRYQIGPRTVALALRTLQSLDIRTIARRHLRELEREFKRIRDLGYAKSNEESVEGVVGYAVPIRGSMGQLAAAIHASVLSKRATKAHERKLLGAARECALKIERQLGNFSAASATGI